MTNRQYWAVNYLCVGALFVTSVFTLWLATGILGFTWDHYNDHHTPSSLYFKTVTMGGLLLVYTGGLGWAVSVWYRDHHAKWWSDRRWRVEARALRRDRDRNKVLRQRDQAKLRELALVAAENEVYSAIAQERPVNADVAALLRTVANVRAET